MKNSVLPENDSIPEHAADAGLSRDARSDSTLRSSGLYVKALRVS